MIRASCKPQTLQLIRRTTIASHASKRHLSLLETFGSRKEPYEGPTAVHPDPLPAETPLLRLNTKPVPNAPAWLTSSPEKFLNYLRAPIPAPVVIRAPRDKEDEHNVHRAETLLRTLRSAPSDRLVEVETGKWDRRRGWDDRISVPLGVYLDWLTDYRKLSGNEDQRMLYLAQWRAHEDVRPSRLLGCIYARFDEVDGVFSRCRFRDCKTS